jgi:hypothetical protein
VRVTGFSSALWKFVAAYHQAAKGACVMAEKLKILLFFYVHLVLPYSLDFLNV